MGEFWPTTLIKMREIQTKRRSFSRATQTLTEHRFFIAMASDMGDTYIRFWLGMATTDA